MSFMDIVQTFSLPLTGAAGVAASIIGSRSQRQVAEKQTTIQQEGVHAASQSASGGGFTVTLPTAVGVSGQAQVYTIKNAGASGTVTIGTTSSQTIDGSAPARSPPGRRLL